MNKRNKIILISLLSTIFVMVLAIGITKSFKKQAFLVNIMICSFLLSKSRYNTTQKSYRLRAGLIYKIGLTVKIRKFNMFYGNSNFLFNNVSFQKKV